MTMATEAVTGQIAVVFGGLGGIGQACCEALLNNGAKVLCADVSDDNDTLTRWRHCHGEECVQWVRCDVTDTNQIKGVFTRCRDEFDLDPDIVINTAGVIDEFGGDKCININLSGAIHVCSITVEQLGKHRGGKGGVFVQFASILALGPGPNVPMYTAAAHGIIGYIRSMAHPLHHGEHGVRLNVLCPTAVDTSLLDSSLSKMYKPELLVQMLASFGGREAIFKPTNVADEVLKVVSDPDTHGQVIRLSKITGVEHLQFEDQPLI